MAVVWKTGLAVMMLMHLTWIQLQELKEFILVKLKELQLEKSQKKLGIGCQGFF